MNRPYKHMYFLDIAKVVATRATCPRLSVGAVLVLNDVIIGSGYNGAPKGFPHCGCELENGHCVTAVHAEVNAIVQAASCGHATEGAALYTNHRPCRACIQVAVNAGIRTFYFESASYGDGGWASEAHEQNKIAFWHLQRGT